MLKVGLMTLFFVFAIIGIVIKAYVLGVSSASGYPNKLHTTQFSLLGKNGFHASPPVTLCETYVSNVHLSSRWISKDASLTIEATVNNSGNWLKKIDTVISAFYRDTKAKIKDQNTSDFQRYLSYFINDIKVIGVTDDENNCPSLTLDECVSLYRAMAQEKNNACPVAVDIFGDFSYVAQFDPSTVIPGGKSFIASYKAKPLSIGSHSLSVGGKSESLLVTKYSGIPDWLASWGSIVLIFLGPAARCLG